MRNELLDLTTILPATAYHQRNYVETYSKFTQPPKTLESNMSHPEMGMVPTAGQGHVGKGPLPAGPRGAYGLAPQQVVRPRGGRPRLARGVH